MKWKFEEIIWIQPVQVKRCKIKNACFKCSEDMVKWSSMYLVKVSERE